jgi:hypothetical protein
MKKISLSIFLAALWVVLLAAPIQAAIITFDNYAKFAGTPELPTFSATIEDLAGGGVRITMDHPVSTDADIVFTWFFNIKPETVAATIPPLPTFTWTGGVQATGQGPTPGTQFGEDVQQADGDGKFDMVFTWPNSGTGQFVEGETSVYEVSNLSVLDFLFLSTPVGGQGPYYSAVEQSAWWGQETPPAVVPIPAAAWLLGTGLVGLVGIRRKYRK